MLTIVYLISVQFILYSSSCKKKDLIEDKERRFFRGFYYILIVWSSENI